MYAVVFTYSFDESCEITLFDNEEETKEYLRSDGGDVKIAAERIFGS